MFSLSRISLYKPSIFPSVIIFIISLFFSGYYTGTTHTPSGAGYQLLLVGWLGVLDGHFSWLANPLYVWALVTFEKKPKVSLFLSIIALCFCGSFILYDEIIVNEAGSRLDITSLGVGYSLWVISISTLSVLALARISIPRMKRLIVFLSSVTLILIPSVVFGFHYFYLPGSHYKIVVARNAFFEANCQEATRIFQYMPNQVTGVYIKPYSWRVNAIGLLNGGKIQFYETDNERHEGKPYLRFTKERKVGFEVEELESEYMLYTESLTEHLPKELGIYGNEEKLIEIAKNRIMSSNRYYGENVLHSVNDRKCGYREGFLLAALF